MCNRCREAEEGLYRTTENLEGQRVTIEINRHGEPIFVTDDGGKFEIWKDPIYENLWFAPVQNA